MSQTKFTKKTQFVLFLTIAAVLPAIAADDTAARLGRAGAVLNTVMDSGRGIRPEQIANADCIAVIPGFKKGAAVVGIGYGRGFISCRSGESWSAPGAITLESGSLGVQLGAEKIDIVILSLDRERRCFPIGSQSGRMLPPPGEMESRRTRTPTPRFFFSVTPRECSPALVLTARP